MLPSRDATMAGVRLLGDAVMTKMPFKESHTPVRAMVTCWRRL